jgi:MFS family permease
MNTGGGRSSRLLLVAVSSGSVLNPLNSSMIAVALVDITRAFKLSFAGASWLISAYYLASAVGQPVMGRLGDLIGRRRVFLAGLVVVGLSGLAAAVAPTFGLLVAARVVQACGSSALYPAGVGILREADVDRRAQALGVMSIVASVSAAIGPTIGGALVGWQGWPTIFLVNLPAVAVSLALALIALPRDDRPWISPGALLRQFDLPGAGCFSAALAFLLAFLVSLHDSPAWWALGLSILAAVVLGYVERRRDRPFLDLAALRANRVLVGVYAGQALANFVFYAIFFGIPSYLQAARGDGAETAGLIMMPITVLAVVTTPFAARLVDRHGSQLVLSAGSVALVAGALVLLAVRPGLSDAGIAGLLALTGIGVGCTNLALQTAMYDAAPAAEMGAASGLFQTARYIGTMLAAGTLGVVFGERIDAAQLHQLALILGAAAVMLTVSTLRRPRPVRLAPR